MKIKINEVRIPQLRKIRTVYEEDGKNYLRMDNQWWELDEYKSFLKDKYAINISYEFV